MTTIAVTLLLFDRCDLLDVGGPYEVFHTANRIVERRGGTAPFRVRTMSSDGAPVRAYGGMRIEPDRDAASGSGYAADASGSGYATKAVDTEHAAKASTTRVLVVPGAVDVEAVVDDGSTIDTLCAAAEAADVIVSVCTGSLLLGAAGLLAGVRGATTHHEDLEALTSHLRDDQVIGGVRWVDAGRVVTAAGLVNGLSVGLHLVHRLCDAELARTVAANLDLPWSEDQGVTLAP